MEADRSGSAPHGLWLVDHSVGEGARKPQKQGVQASIAAERFFVGRENLQPGRRTPLQPAVHHHNLRQNGRSTSSPRIGLKAGHWAGLLSCCRPSAGIGGQRTGQQAPDCRGAKGARKRRAPVRGASLASSDVEAGSDGRWRPARQAESRRDRGLGGE